MAPWLKTPVLGRRVQILLDFIEKQAYGVYHGGRRFRRRLNVDRQPSHGCDKARVAVVVGVDLEQHAPALVNVNAVAGHPHLLGQQVAALGPPVEHHVDMAAGRRPVHAGGPGHGQGEHVAQPAVIHEVGQQHPTLASGHAEQWRPLAKPYVHRLLWLGQRGVAATLYFGAFGLKKHDSIGRDHPKAAVGHPFVTAVCRLRARRIYKNCRPVAFGNGRRRHGHDGRKQGYETHIHISRCSKLTDTIDLAGVLYTFATILCALSGLIPKSHRSRSPLRSLFGLCHASPK